MYLETEEAVNRAIDEMPEDYVIQSFLVEHRSEVQMGFLTGISEEELKELFRADGRKDGFKEIITKKVRKGMPLEAIASDMEENIEDIKELYDEVCAELSNHA